MENSEEKPFNPFYIGAHPSKACAAPDASGQQCCKDGQDSAKQDSAAAPAGQGSSADNPCPEKIIECMQGRGSENPSK